MFYMRGIKHAMYVIFGINKSLRIDLCGKTIISVSSETSSSSLGSFSWPVYCKCGEITGRELSQAFSLHSSITY